MRDSQGAKYVVDHTPVYGHVQEFIDLIVPNATYLHVVRDAIDVVSSLRSVKAAGATWGQSNDEARFEFRKHWVDISRAIGEKAVGRYYEITYEDFCANPANTLSPVMQHLGIGWEDTMSAAMQIRYAQNNHIQA